MNRIDPTQVLEPIPERQPPTAKLTTAKVFAVFAAAWPRYETSEAQLTLWAHQIGDLPERTALAAAEAIVRTDDWWPTLARYLETAGAIQRRQAEHRPHLELNEARDLELARRRVSEIRSDLA